VVELRAGGEMRNGPCRMCASDIGVGHRVVVSELPIK
jgi:hypothetical protein